MVQKTSASQRRLSTKGRLAFLVICVGGTGAAAARHVRALHDADGQPFPLYMVRIDTDPDPANGFDRSISIGMDAEKIETVTMNPKLFGPVVELIVQQHSHLLEPEDAANGSRTIRILTQLAYLYHLEFITSQLRGAILELYKAGGFEFIAPYLVSSSGGGAGSALQILLAQSFADPSVRARLMEGLPAHKLLKPISMVVEPFAYALRCQNSQADMILANAMAFRKESAELERRRDLKYVIHLGMANENGVVLDTPEDIAKVLGISLYQFQFNWLAIKAQLVNNVDTNRLIRFYAGHDTPEIVLGNGNSSADTNH